MRISMPRGDIKWQRFIVRVPKGSSTDIDFTNIYFTVKKNSKDVNYLFQKSLRRQEIFKLGPGDYQFKINPEDTENLTIGEYKFDIQISYKNLLKETFVGDFSLKEEITYPENEDVKEPDGNYELPHSSETSAVILTIPDYHILELTTPVTIGEASGDYNNLLNIPKINNVTLTGELSLSDLGIQPAGNYASEALTLNELESIIQES